MTRISWDAIGERFYEKGVDRTVLYVDTAPGVPWPGVIAVNEAPTGGDARAFYQDGIKYANFSAREDFAASLNAFSAPREFAPCEGLAAIQNGLFITHQPRKSFGMTYRTLVGNDTEGPSHGYKIHLVYNALAGPSQRNNASISNEVAPNSLTWELTTLPPKMSGVKPTAHLVIDSRYTPGSLLEYIEGLLYGTEGTPPRLPSAEELIELFKSPGPIVARNLSTNPSVETNLVTIGRGFSTNAFVRDDTKAKAGTYSVKATAVGTGGSAVLWTIPTIVGQTYTFGVWVWSPAGTSNIAPSAYFISNGVSNAVKDQWVFISHIFTATAATTQVGAVTGATVVGESFWADSLIVIEGEVVLTGSFDGDTPDTEDAIFEWVGTPHASQSIQRSLF